MRADYASAKALGDRADVRLALRMGWVATRPYRQLTSKASASDGSVATDAADATDTGDQIVSFPFVRINDSTLRAFLFELFKRIANQAPLTRFLFIYALSNSQRGGRSNGFGPASQLRIPRCQKNCRFPSVFSFVAA